MAHTKNRPLQPAESQNRTLWMIAIIALLGALAYVALQPTSRAPAAPAASGPLNPAAVQPAATGPLGPFAGVAAPEQSALAPPSEWTMEGQNAARTRAVAESLTLPLTRQRVVAMPRDHETGSPPVLAGGLMLVETKDHLRAFDLRNGAERWTFSQNGSYISPAVAGERVFIRAESGDTGQVIALDLQSGRSEWQFTPRRLSSSATGSFGGHLSSPVIVDDQLYVAAGKELYALDTASGAVGWEFKAQNYVTSSATVAGGRVFISDFDYIYGVDQATGELLWTYPAASAISFSPVASEQAVLVTSGESVAALDAATGKELWSFMLPGEKMVPAGMQGGLAFVKSTETLYALQLADGREAWRFRETNFVSLPALAGNQVFVVSGIDASSAVVALDAATGKSVWRQPVPALASTAPVIAGGAVYVRMGDGRVLGLWN
jgi:outer membrane protein assembly factor BamB